MQFPIFSVILFFAATATTLEKNYRHLGELLDFHSTLKYFASQKPQKKQSFMNINFDIMNLNDSGVVMKSKNTGRVEVYPGDVVSRAEKILIKYSIAAIEEERENITKFSFTTDSSYFQNEQTAFIVAHTPKSKKKIWRLPLPLTFRSYLFNMSLMSRQEYYNHLYINESKATRQIHFGYAMDISNNIINPYNPAEQFNDSLLHGVVELMVSLPNISWFLWTNGFDFLKYSILNSYSEEFRTPAVARYMESARTLTKLGELLIRKEDVNKQTEALCWEHAESVGGYPQGEYNIDNRYRSAYEWAMYNDNIEAISYMIECGKLDPTKYCEPRSERMKELIARK